MRLITHSGTFHADDAAAFAVLSAVFPSASLVRTRDASVLASAKPDDVVFDVGGTYDPAARRYDHHMADGPKRADGSPYSSVGLAWKHHGMDYVAAVCPDAGAEEAMKVWDSLDRGLIREIDLADNGVGELGALDLPVLVDAFNPAWDDEAADEDAAFAQASAFVGGAVRREAVRALSRARAWSIVDGAARAAADPRIIELPRHLPWEDAVFEGGHDAALYVVYPRGGSWYCTAVPDRPGSFGKRMPMPSSWGGLRGAELEKETGVAGAVFCHPALFVCAAGDREGALSMALAAAGPVSSPEP